MERNNTLGEFIELCRKCALTCKQCPEQCDKEGCSTLCREQCRNCYLICDKIVQKYFDNAFITKEDIKNCKIACNACAEECEKHNCQHCIQCAIDCRKCAEKTNTIILIS